MKASRLVCREFQDKPTDTKATPPHVTVDRRRAVGGVLPPPPRRTTRIAATASARSVASTAVLHSHRQAGNPPDEFQALLKAAGTGAGDHCMPGAPATPAQSAARPLRADRCFAPAHHWTVRKPLVDPVRGTMHRYAMWRTTHSTCVNRRRPGNSNSNSERADAASTRRVSALWCSGAVRAVVRSRLGFAKAVKAPQSSL
ncbi:hypothetical protein ANO11243_008640 [Dothideomycetidae sp. 11243]|nr:hypothetical protein ANO11243_008640 [fungal sp. No.11243]